jgi:D-alanine-D-alanine ligase-like ATP-grasp enzyme
MIEEPVPLLDSLCSAIGATVHVDVPATFAWMRWDGASDSADGADARGAGAVVRWPDAAVVAQRIADAVPALAAASADPPVVDPTGGPAEPSLSISSPASTHGPADPAGRALVALCALIARIAWHLQQQPDGGHGVVVPHAGTPTADRAPAPDRPRVAAYCAHAFAEFGEPALRIAAALVRAACRRDAGALRRAAQAVQGLRAACAAARLDGASDLMRRRALQRGIPVYRVSPRIRLLQLGQGVRAHRTFESGVDLDAHTGARLAANKMATAELLHRLGLPGAVHRPARDVDEARRIARAYGYPVVVKPSHGEKQTGVTIGVRDDVELPAAFEKARGARAGLVLVERFAPGTDFRLLVVGGRLASVALRRPATVIGDGRSTVDALIDALNADPRRGPGDAYALVSVGRDAELDEALDRQGVRLSDIPAAGVAVYLRVNPTPMHGGTVEECIERVHPDIRAMAETIARALKVQVLGIDFICPDISRSWREVGGAVCEVNLTPGHRPHGQRGIDAILGLLFPNGDDGRIPTVATLGPRADVQCRLTAALLGACGRTVGRVIRGAVSVGGIALRPPDGATPPSPTAVFEHPDVDCAVIALDDDAAQVSGLPFDRCDVLVTTSDDAVVLAHVLPRVRGAVVIGRAHLTLGQVVMWGSADRIDRMGDTIDGDPDAARAEPHAAWPHPALALMSNAAPGSHALGSHAAVAVRLADRVPDGDMRRDAQHALAACLRLGLSEDALARALRVTGIVDAQGGA